MSSGYRIVSNAAVSDFFLIRKKIFVTKPKGVFKFKQKLFIPSNRFRSFNNFLKTARPRLFFSPLWITHISFTTKRLRKIKQDPYLNTQYYIKILYTSSCAIWKKLFPEQLPVVQALPGSGFARKAVPRVAG